MTSPLMRTPLLHFTLQATNQGIMRIWHIGSSCPLIMGVPVQLLCPFSITLAEVLAAATITSTALAAPVPSRIPTWADEHMASLDSALLSHHASESSPPDSVTLPRDLRVSFLKYTSLRHQIRLPPRLSLPMRISTPWSLPRVPPPPGLLLQLRLRLHTLRLLYAHDYIDLSMYRPAGSAPTPTPSDPSIPQK